MSNRSSPLGESRAFADCHTLTEIPTLVAQYWYHYEEWREGEKARSWGFPHERLNQEESLFPKRLVARVETKKVPVEETLKVLKNRNKKQDNY